MQGSLQFLRIGQAVAPGMATARRPTIEREMQSLRLSKSGDATRYLLFVGLVGAALIGSYASDHLSGAAVDVAPPLARPAQGASGAPAGDLFLKRQSLTQWRAPLLIGVSVYDADGRLVGKIKDLLMSHEGVAAAVVIGVGGFLGFGAKDVAVPFAALQWRTDGRVSSTTYASLNAPPRSRGGARLRPRIVDPAVTEAKQGRPDRAYVAMTLAQFQSAPQFEYAASALDNLDYEAISREQSLETPYQ